MQTAKEEVKVSLSANDLIFRKKPLKAPSKNC